MKRLVLADDHAMVLDGLRRILSAEYEVVGTALDGRRVVDFAQKLRPDLVVLDVSMPQLNGIEAARQILKLLPAIKIIFVTQQLDPNYVRAALDAGAAGYVAKQSASTEMLRAVRAVLEGRYYVTPLAWQRPDQPPSPGVSRSNPAEMFGKKLTGRQREVLQLIAEGKTAKQIATALGLSAKTVEFHRNALMDSLGMRTTAELTRYALIHGIIQ